MGAAKQVRAMSKSDRLSSLDNYRAWEKRLLGNVWSNAAESDLRETVVIAYDGSVQSRTPGRISAAIASERAKGKRTSPAFWFRRSSEYAKEYNGAADPDGDSCYDGR
jgi:hypothetical protein